MTDPLRIATFNLESLDRGSGRRPSLAARAEVLCPQLDRLQADVLCLQEIHGQWTPGRGERRLLALEELLTATRYADFHRISTTSRAGHGVADVHNLVILSRWPLEDPGEWRHDLVPAPRVTQVTAATPAAAEQAIEWDRPALSAAVCLPDGRRLRIVNLHLRAPLAAPVEGQKVAPFKWRSVGGWAEGFFLAALKRNGQALEARLLVEQFFDADPQALIAVCGDFNAELREMPLRILRGEVEDTGNPDLASRVLMPLERLLPEPQRYSLLHAGRRILLDHLLVSPALLARFRDLEIHNEDLIDEVTAAPETPRSFHAPLVAAFEI